MTNGQRNDRAFLCAIGGLSVESINFKRTWLYWLPSFVCSYFWVIAVAVLTNLFAPFGITFFTAGMLVVVPALLMPLRRGFVSVLLGGFLVDASMPIPFDYTGAFSTLNFPYSVSLFGVIPSTIPAFFGFITGWMIFAYLILRLIRSRLDLVSPIQWVVCAAIANSVIFLFWGIAMGWSRIETLDYWLGFGCNFLFSTLLLFVCGAWYFDLIVSAYRICGVDLVMDREV